MCVESKQVWGKERKCRQSNISCVGRDVEGIKYKTTWEHTKKKYHVRRWPLVRRVEPLGRRVDRCRTSKEPMTLMCKPWLDAWLVRYVCIRWTRWESVTTTSNRLRTDTRRSVLLKRAHTLVIWFTCHGILHLSNWKLKRERERKIVWRWLPWTLRPLRKSYISLWPERW